MKANSAVLLGVAVLLAFAAGVIVAGELGGVGGSVGSAVCAENVEALFSPGAGEEIVGLVRSANSSVHVEMYQFSYGPLLSELIEAEKRGVDVRVILEPRLDGDDNLESMRQLKEGGVDARWASLEFARTHSKTLVVDGKKVLVGSPNWSYNAMLRNRESAVVVEGIGVAGEFERIFEEDWRKGSAG